MKRVYSVKIDGQLAMEVLAGGTVAPETLAGWLREAADSLSGGTKTCGSCNQTTYKHEGFACQDCGGVSVPLLSLVKGRG